MTDEEYWNQGTSRMEELVSTVADIIKTFPEPKRAQVNRMMDGPVGEQYMMAPASSRRRYHNCFPGGLVIHSLGVARHAVLLGETLAKGRWPAWKLMFCGLFHDLGKAGARNRPYYTPTKEEWKRKKGEYYDIYQGEWQPSSERGLFILQEEGVVLDHEETMAIRLNDGAGPAENKPYQFREPDLALIVHWADHWQSRLEKAEDTQSE